MTDIPALLPPDPTVPRLPMVRARLRDRPRLAWLMAREFARPDRNPDGSGRVNTCAAVMSMPFYLLVAADRGLFHWEYRAVITLHRTWALGTWVRRLLVALTMALPPAALATVALRPVLAALTLLALSAVTGVAWARADMSRAAKHKRAKAVTPQGPGAARPAVRLPWWWRARWNATAAAAEPGLEAMDAIFGPHLFATVPSGQSVEAMAATQYLAGKYQEKGFSPVAGKPRRVVARRP